MIFAGNFLVFVMHQWKWHQARKATVERLQVAGKSRRMQQQRRNVLQTASNATRTVQIKFKTDFDPQAESLKPVLSKLDKGSSKPEPT